MPLIKNAIKPLTKSVLIPLGLTAAASAPDAGLQKKFLGSRDNNKYTIYIYIYIYIYISEIKVVEKGLDYAPIQSKINESELRNDFEDFCRWMRLRYYFRIEPTCEFSETPSFTPKSLWKAPKGHPSLEVFLSEIEKEIFAIQDSRLGYSNLSREEWQAMRSLADDRSIMIKKADKGSSVVVWDRYDYIAEAEKQLKDQNVYKDVDFNEKIYKTLQKLVTKCFEV